MSEVDDGTSGPLPRADDREIDRGHRGVIEFGLDAADAERLVAVVDAATSVPDDLDDVVAALALDDVAEAAWVWWGDDDLLGEPLDPLMDLLGTVDDAPVGAVWLQARHLAWHGRTDDALALLEAARPSGSRLVLADLAAVEADRSNAGAARDLLRAAGADVDIDLDSLFDPNAPDRGFAQELAEEIAPFAALRPRPMAGRNDRCPCGSGKKYKQCHLGRELHPIGDRAGWLYVKLTRFLQINRPLLPAAIGDDIADAVSDEELRDMVHDSFLAVDLAIFEGGVAEWFLEARGPLLPDDEVELLRSWIGATRTVLEVERSRPTSMDVIDLATRERKTVVDTVPEMPLDAGWKIIGRLVPVGDGYRAYGGFLPVNDDMVDGMLEGFATRSLDTVTLAIGQIFESAATHDDLQQAFADGLDTSALDELLSDLGNSLGDGTAEAQDTDDPE